MEISTEFQTLSDRDEALGITNKIIHARNKKLINKQRKELGIENEEFVNHEPTKESYEASIKGRNKPFKCYKNLLPL